MKRILISAAAILYATAAYPITRECQNTILWFTKCEKESGNRSTPENNSRRSTPSKPDTPVGPGNNVPDKPDRPGNGKPDKPERPDRPSKPDRPDKPGKPDTGGDKPDRDRHDHGKGDHSAGKGKGHDKGGHGGRE